jgi:ATP-dependent DNA ligase
VVQSRRGADLSRSFPNLATAVVEQLPKETVLDDEAVVGVDGRLDFTELQKRVASPARAASLARERPATFLAFHLLVTEGEDLPGLPVVERRGGLTALMQTCRPPLQQVPFTLDREQAAQWLRDYVAHIGIKGLVVSGSTSLMSAGRDAGPGCGTGAVPRSWSARSPAASASRPGSSSPSPTPTPVAG